MKETEVPIKSIITIFAKICITQCMCSSVNHVLTVGVESVWAVVRASLSVSFGSAFPSPYKKIDTHIVWESNAIGVRAEHMAYTKKLGTPCEGCQYLPVEIATCVHVYTYTQSTRQGKAKQPTRENNSFLGEKNELPQAGIKPARYSTN